MQPRKTKRLGTQRHGAGIVRAHRFFHSFRWDKFDRLKIKPPYKPPLSLQLDMNDPLEGFTNTAFGNYQNQGHSSMGNSVEDIIENQPGYDIDTTKWSLAVDSLFE